MKHRTKASSLGIITLSILALFVWVQPAEARGWGRGRGMGYGRGAGYGQGAGYGRAMGTGRGMGYGLADLNLNAEQKEKTDPTLFRKS